MGGGGGGDDPWMEFINQPEEKRIGKGVLQVGTNLWIDGVSFQNNSRLQ